MTPVPDTIRPIRDDELALFASIGATPEGAARMAAFLDEIFALGESKPAWCYLAFADGLPVARVIYVGLNVDAGDFALNGLALPWASDPVPVGRALLTASRAQMGDAVKTLGVAVWADDPHAEAKTALMQALGWPMAQDRRRYERQAHANTEGAPARLRFRSADAVGREAFVAAIAEVTRGTLDQALADDVERLGLQTAAERHWQDLTHMDGRTARYELAYDTDDALVGLIVPHCHGGEMGIIGYIGVVPPQRGHGYVRDLLCRAVETLEATEPALTRIIADIDAGNAPMARALEATGFTLTRAERRYRGS
jgi:RimJ/RimL family protein N-acetyltransferase